MVGRKSWMKHLVACGVAVVVSSSTASATILTFDQNVPVTNFENVDQGYGDNVAGPGTPGGLEYGEAGEGYTPNVTVDYGPAGADPALWTTGYGDLTNILFKDADNFPTLAVTLTAEPGYLVSLYSWDMAAFGSVFSSDPSIDSVTVYDSEGAVLFSTIGQTISETTHTAFDFSAAPFVDDQLVLEFDSSNLGGLSDDIAIDNIRFGQQSVPEPASVAIALLGVAGLLARCIPVTLTRV